MLQPVAAAAEARRRTGRRGGLVDGLGVNQRTKERGAKAGRGACCSLNRPERGGAPRRPRCLLLVEHAGEGWRYTEAEVPAAR